ncbi:MAG: coniferyl aldehyde dehydrogenase [Deltaproteobacteria bacterium]|nr:MAG: coniferyl aldehyde dehydrogenase [Deltaproteobacteria bacterium]
MSQPEQAPSADPTELVRAPYARLRAAWSEKPVPTLGQRSASLERLATWVLDHRDEIASTISEDFGGRSRYETLLAEIWVVVTGIRHAQRHLRKWMKPERRKTYWVLQPASVRVIRQPLGVVGIIAPWNYPFQLAFAPLTAAIAAGNRALIKPSEVTPRTADLIERLVSEVFPDDEVAVVKGDAAVGAAFCELPFDHLFFTGSTQVGRKVMQAAAKNLTPVTLELGGKSPAWIHPAFDLTRAASRIAAGKWFNAGQTCIAPDYVLISAARRDELVEQLRAAVHQAYPTIQGNDDYTSIIDERHFTRLRSLVDDATQAGAKLVWLHSEGAPATGSSKLPPAVVLDATPDMRILKEEIFGPILPIVTVEDQAEAIRYINERPRPLAMYVFDDDRGRVDHILHKTVAGGCVVNDTLLHYANEDLPFGGVGESGMGAYHGEEGFLTFSHRKSVFYQPKLNGAHLVNAPYGAMVDRLLSIVLR